MPPLPPAPHKGRRGTVINDTSQPLEPTVSRARFALRRGGFVSSSRVTVLSVLPDVSAEHTFEVIPKSMILLIIKRKSVISSDNSRWNWYLSSNYQIEFLFCSPQFPASLEGSVPYTENIGRWCLVLHMTTKRISAIVLNLYVKPSHQLQDPEGLPPFGKR